MPSNPTYEQQCALVRFAAAAGKKWKKQLRECWRTGKYPPTTAGDDVAELQSLRNQLGPGWLNGYQGVNSE